jgi:hypothetical protein
MIAMTFTFRIRTSAREFRCESRLHSNRAKPVREIAKYARDALAAAQ